MVAEGGPCRAAWTTVIARSLEASTSGAHGRSPSCSALALLRGVRLWGVQALALLLGLSALGGSASAAAGRTF